MDRRASQEYENHKRAALWRKHKLGEKPHYRWQKAVERWFLKSTTRANLEDSKIHLRWVHQFVYDVYLDAIDKSLLDKIVQARRAEGVPVATINRLLEIIRAILRKAAGE